MKRWRKPGWFTLVAFVCLFCIIPLSIMFPKSPPTPGSTPLASRPSAAVIASATAAIPVESTRRAMTSTPPASATPTAEPTTIREAQESALATAMSQVAGVKSIDMIAVMKLDRDDIDYTVYAEITTDGASSTTTTATALRQAAHRVLVSAKLDFSVIIYDGKVAKDYIWDNRTDRWRVTTLSITPPPR